MPEAMGTLAIAIYGSLVSSATAAALFYQLHRKRRRLAYSFEHHPLRIHDDVGYIDDYVVKAILVNRSESEMTVLLCEFGIGKDVGRGFPDRSLEGYGRHKQVEFPLVIPAMSAKVLHCFARHLQGDNLIDGMSGDEINNYRLYMTIQVVGVAKECVEIQGAGPSLLRHKVVRAREH